MNPHKPAYIQALNEALALPAQDLYTRFSHASKYRTPELPMLVTAMHWKLWL
jgi:hypothetical protein